MNLEGITINVLTAELQKRLLGGKIYKIFMPNKNCLLLLIKTENTTLSLAADFSGSSPYLYLPEKTPERPDTPPTFCMLLRKHLEEGRITKIEQSGLDRVITMEISSIGSARQIIAKQLIFELTGKNANIIFTADGIILDSLKHVNKAQSSYRQILPTKKGDCDLYSLPLFTTTNKPPAKCRRFILYNHGNKIDSYRQNGFV